jgi:hypothetical protein
MTIDKIYKKKLDLSSVFGLCWIVLDNEMVEIDASVANQLFTKLEIWEEVLREVFSPVSVLLDEPS